MIFRWIQRRRFHRLFGQYISAHVIDNSMVARTEWEAFRYFTDPWNPFIDRDPNKMHDAYVQVAAMAYRARRQGEREEAEKRSTQPVQPTPIRPHPTAGRG